MLRARLAPALALASVTAASACSETPSFTVRWRLHPHTDEAPSADDTPLLVSVEQCTEFGIGKIRLTTADAAGATIDEREFPCFPRSFADRDAFAPGPEVGPGTYAVTVTALGRRDVQFCADPITNDAGGELQSQPCQKTFASVATEVVVRETGEGQKLPELVIVAAPECSDGVDNDRDGYTDLADPSCEGDRLGRERGDSAGAQIVVRPQLMSGNPSAYCEGLGLAEIELDIAGPTAITRRFPCGTVARTFTEDLEPGDYTLSIAGLDYSGKPVASPDLDPERSSFTLAPEGFQSVELAVDFTIASFEAPIEAGFTFTIAYVSAEDELPLTTCTPGQGNLVIERARITVLDADMNVLPTAALRDGTNPPIVLDGVTTVPCEQLLKLRSIEPFVWDDETGHEALYLSVESFPAGSDTPCFGNADAPAPAAPNASLALQLPRLSDEGACAD